MYLRQGVKCPKCGSSRIDITTRHHRHLGRGESCPIEDGAYEGTTGECKSWLCGHTWPIDVADLGDWLIGYPRRTSPTDDDAP